MQARKIPVVCFILLGLISFLVQLPVLAQQSQNSKLNALEFDDDAPPVGDQVPCILTHKQTYGMRGFRAPASQPQPPATIVAQAFDSEATAQPAPPMGDDSTDAKIKRAKIQAFASVAQTLRTSTYSTTTKDFLKRVLPGVEANAVATAVTASGAAGAEKKTVTDTVTSSGQQISDKALSDIPSAFPRPKDISCSMSVLSWDEAHKAFGRTIADTYLAIQITVRNLDGNNEFLVHDAELAVDANSAQLSRFQVGHEKELARGVLLYGQNYDRQHIVINIFEGVGTILGAIVGLPQPSNDGLTGATGAYHAGLLPAIHLLSPDLTTKNLNTLNDLAFSAASASRIVVPKSGSVPFVVFIPVKPLEQACWLQSGYNIYDDDSPTSACDQVCGNKKSGPQKQSSSEQQQDSNDANSNPCTNQQLSNVQFKHWTPVQVQALQLHSYALVAGAHVKELSSQGAVLNAFICAGQTDTSGKYLQAPLATLGLNCTLSGTDLDTMTILRLRSPADPSATLDAKVTVSGDNTQATAVLAPTDATKIQQPSYELYGVDKAGSEQDLKRSVGFHLAPTVAAGQTIPAAGSFALTGSNLADVSQIVFYNTANTSEVARVPVLAAADGSISFTVPPAAAFPAGTTYSVRLILSDVPTLVIDTKAQVTH
jgi:hypothetical protein